jgi:tetratricopeptide (TPR) repeat protein
MILSAIVKFYKRLSRLLKKIPAPSLPRLDLPKPRRPKAPKTKSYFMESVVSTLVHARGITFKGFGQSIKRVFRFAATTHAATASKRWYHISPKFFIKLALIALLPELLLQGIAFYVWLSPRYDKTPSVLCISDSDITYPEKLQEQIKKSNLKWKVIQAIDERLTIATARKMIDAYKSSRNIPLIYLSVGFNDFLQLRYPKPLVTWDNSFEWKWRTPELASLLSTGDIHPAIESDPIREVQTKESYLKKKFRHLFHLNRNDAGQEILNTTQSKTSSSANLQPEPPKPVAFDNLRLDSLASKPSPESDFDFPAGKWNSGCLTMDFHQDGKGSFAGSSIEWIAQNNQLSLTRKERTLDRKERPLEFLWHKEGEQLLLLTDYSPIVFVMKKVTDTKPDDSQGFRKITRAWISLNTGDPKLAEVTLDEAERICSSDTVIAALKARIYYDSGRLEEAKKKVLWLQNLYENKPDQEVAESLLFAMVGESDEKKAKVAAELLNQYPKSIRLWVTVSEYAKKSGNEKIASSAIDHALDLLPEFLFRTRKLIMRSPNSNKQRDPSMIEAFNLKRERIFDQLHSIFHENLTQTNIANAPKMVIVPYASNSIVNKFMMDIASAEKTETINLSKLNHLMENQNTGNNPFQLPSSNKSEKQSVAISDEVVRDFKERLKLN